MEGSKGALCVSCCWCPVAVLFSFASVVVSCSVYFKPLGLWATGLFPGFRVGCSNAAIYTCGGRLWSMG
eukprot:scaffold98819_cov29-Tisochrysis_lutea.AAC.1